MTEEYMTSAEIREKIAELKIRLAFQLEFEEELKKTLAECEDADSEQEEQRTDRSAEILGRIEAEARKRKSRAAGRRRTRRVGKIVAIAAILMTISCGSALAAICGLVEAGILKFDVKVQEKGTIFELLRPKNKVDVPDGWQGKYYPSYIPDGYEIGCVNDFGVRLVDGKGGILKFDENIYGDRVVADTEYSVTSSIMMNDVEVMVVEKSGWTTVVWSMDNKYFVVEGNEGKEIVLRVASSVSLIK